MQVPRDRIKSHVIVSFSHCFLRHHNATPRLFAFLLVQECILLGFGQKVVRGWFKIILLNRVSVKIVNASALSREAMSRERAKDWLNHI